MFHCPRSWRPSADPSGLNFLFPLVRIAVAAASLEIEESRSQTIQMAMSAGHTIYVDRANVTAEADQMVKKAGLHGMMTVAYAIVTHAAIVVLSAVRTEQVLRRAGSGWGFGRVPQDIVAITPSIRTAGLTEREP